MMIMGSQLLVSGGWYGDDTKRFEAYGWHVIRDVDGHDFKAVDEAIKESRSVKDNHL